MHTSWASCRILIGRLVTHLKMLEGPTVSISDRGASEVVFLWAIAVVYRIPMKYLGTLSKWGACKTPGAPLKFLDDRLLVDETSLPASALEFSICAILSIPISHALTSHDGDYS